MSEEIELKEKERNPFNSVRRKYKLMPTKAKIRLIIRILIIILCAFGLFTQTKELIDQYQSGETLVKMHVDHSNFNKIPAITICFPRLYSMEKISQKYNLSEIYENYLTLKSNATENDYENNNEFKKSLTHIYENFTKIVEKSNPNFNEMMSLSIPFEYNSAADMLSPAEVEISGARRYSDGTFRDQQIIGDEKPIPSIVLGWIKYPHKCFTYFSLLNKRWNKYQMDITEISIEVPTIDEHIPRNLVKRLKMSIHSPNTIPQQLIAKDFFEFNFGERIEMTYNRWKTILKGEGYKPFCKTYNLEDEHNYKIRSDCINHCIQKRLNKCTKVKNNRKNNTHEECLFPVYSVWNNQTFPIDRNIKKCAIDSNDLIQLYSDNIIGNCFLMEKGENECQNKCQIECSNRYYNFDIKYSKVFDSEMTLILIAHNQMPDQITEHLPEMSLISCVANFGGLLGMWLGLSALAILDFVLKMC